MSDLWPTAATGLLWLAVPVAIVGVVARLNRRDRRQREVQAQIWEMGQAIREEAMSDEERAWLRESRQRQADITREARRRLGLSEEEVDG